MHVQVRNGAIGRKRFELETEAGEEGPERISQAPV
jgi:hypothetical protein